MMTDEQFRHLIEDLQQGRTERFGQFFLENYNDAVNRLVKRFGCQLADAEDLVMNAFVKLERRLIMGKITNRNLTGYLMRIADNAYLDKQKAPKPLANLLDTERVEYFLSQHEGATETDFNPLLQKEDAQQLSRQEHARLLAYQTAWKQLSDKCRQLLEGFYIFNQRLSELAQKLQLTEGSAKSTKYQCKEQFKKHFYQSINP